MYNCYGQNVSAPPKLHVATQIPIIQCHQVGHDQSQMILAKWHKGSGESVGPVLHIPFLPREGILEVILEGFPQRLNSGCLNLGVLSLQLRETPYWVVNSRRGKLTQDFALLWHTSGKWLCGLSGGWKRIGAHARSSPDDLQWNVITILESTQKSAEIQSLLNDLVSSSECWQKYG